MTEDSRRILAAALLALVAVLGVGRMPAAAVVPAQVGLIDDWLYERPTDGSLDLPDPEDS